MRRAYLWATVVVVVLVGVGLAIGQSGEGGTRTGAGGTAAGGNAPGSSVTGGKGAVVTIAGQPASVTNGAQLYAANCQTCHGTDGQGGQYRGVGSEVSRRGFGAFKDIIMYGRERMPGYAQTGLSTSDNLGKLGNNGYLGNKSAPTDQQIRDLMAYLESLPQRGERGGGGFFRGDD